jgi:hypothetical protein
MGHFASENNELGNLYVKTYDIKLFTPCYDLYYKNNGMFQLK